jgi:FkbM family methyltransferase
MNRLSLFNAVAYDIILHDSGTCHYVNDTDFFSQYYLLVVRGDADIIDVGFNVGMQAELVLPLTTGKVIGFEASKQIYDFAANKFKENDRVHLFNTAISNSSGIANFFDTELWGAGSLKQTAGMRASHAEEHNLITVELKRLDDLLSHENNIGLMKIDIEGAEILALDGARCLLERNRPFIVMEYCHNALAFEFDGEPIDQMTLYDFARQIGYKVYNIYGICLSNPEVWKSSILRDTADVFLIPNEQHDRWINDLLPKYQYKIYDIISEHIEWSKKPSNFYRLVGLPSRIYSKINTLAKDTSLEYLKNLCTRLKSQVIDRNEIINTNKLSRRSEVLLTLLYDQNYLEAYNIASIKDLSPDELKRFELMV